jgi:seryl-tRNA synthetase
MRAMLDRRFILQNLDEIRQNIANRNVVVDLDEFVRLESRWRALTAEQEELNRQANKLASANTRPSAEQIELGRQLKTRRAELEVELRAAESEMTDLQASIPNMTHPAAPVGATDEANLEIARGATPVREFAFQPKDHLDLGVKLGVFDFESASRTTGHGFYYLKGDAVLLDLALQQFVVMKLAGKGFLPHVTPDLARSSLSAGTGYNPRGNETQVYSIAGTDLSLIATSEITLAGLEADSIVAEERLPITVSGLSHCFRTEAGSHGRAARGLYRVHQFTKVEMFAFTRPEESDEMHGRLLETEREIFDDLEIPYRVVENATGDLGAAAYRKFDIEAWMPGRGDGGAWGEVTSVSNCTDYQARRLNIRFRDKESGKVRLVHTLNGTAVATGRALIAIFENYQQEDGTIAVPKALQPFAGIPVVSGTRA